MTFCLPVSIDDLMLDAVVDSAAQATVISTRVIRKLHRNLETVEMVKLKGITDTTILGRRVKACPLTVGTITYAWDMYEADIEDDLLLGLDFLHHHGCRVNFKRLELEIDGRKMKCQLYRRGIDGRQYHLNVVYLSKKTILPPGGGHVKCYLGWKTGESEDIRFSDPSIPSSSTLLVSPVPEIETPDILIASTLVKSQNREIPLRIHNLSLREIVLQRGQPLAVTECVDDICGDLREAEDTLFSEPLGDISSLDLGIDSIQHLNCPEYYSQRKVVLDSDASEQDYKCSEEETSPEYSPGVPKHLQKLFEESSLLLSESQAAELGSVLSEYQDRFSKGDEDLGCFTKIKHQIDTNDARPIRQKMRRTPIGFQDEEDKLLKKMLASKVVEESNSAWASPSVLVRKKDGTVRWCIDFRAVNSVTVKDAYPLPNIEECLDTLAGSQFFSTLDMASGYWQIEMEEKDKPKTAFLTKHGLYQFTRMPFGLCNAPSTFQRAMHLVFRGMTWRNILTYLDDLMIVGQDFDDHMNNLKMALDRLRSFDLKLKPKKCNLFQTDVRFLGRMVSREGVSISPENIKAVQERKAPTNVQELQSFLGWTNYHREHVKDYARIANCLYALTGTKVPFVWEEVHQLAFETLKTTLVQAPILGYPRIHDTFILDTDASDVAIGAELSQLQDGIEVVISYGSYVLTPEQRRYCTTRKELLAIVRFTRQYRHYLLGQIFVIRTDHSSLTWLMRFKHLEGQLARWLEELSQYILIIQHRPGKHHQNADGLSRPPDPYECCDCYRAGLSLDQLPCQGCKYCTRAHEQWSRFEDDVDDVIPLAVRTINFQEVLSEDEIPSEQEDLSEDIVSTGNPQGFCNWLTSYSKEELRSLQVADQHLGVLVAWLEKNHQPSQNELQLSSPTVKRFWQYKDQLCLNQGVLYYRWEELPQSRLLLLVPDCLKTEVLEGCHDLPTGGHMGQRKTYERIRQKYLWHAMSVDVKLYVRSCAVCNRQKHPSVRPKASLGSYQAGAPMERIHIDILGPLTESNRHNKYVLLLVDQFSKWVEIHALPDQSAELIARTVVEQVFSRFGSPLEIHSDQGKNFDGNVFKALCRLYRTAKTRTTPYRPCSNGQVERYNRLLLQLIRCYLNGKQKDWDKDLQLLAAAIRATPNRRTGFTANMLFLGREVQSPIDLVMGIPAVGQTTSGPPAYVSQLRKTLAEVHELARKELKASQLVQKRSYDSRLHERKYDVGDVVYKLNTGSKRGEHRKLKSVWAGHLLVTGVLSSVLYRVKDRKRECVLHHDRLKMCEDRYLPMWIQRLRHNILQLDTTLPYEEEAELSLSVLEEDPAAMLQSLFLDENVNSKASEECSFSEESEVEAEPAEASVILQEEETIINEEETEQAEASVTLHEEEPIINEEETFPGELDEASVLPTPCEFEYTTRTGRISKKPKYLAEYHL